MEDRPLVDLLLVIGTSLKVSPVSDMLSKSWLVDVMKPYSSRVSPSTTFGATGMYNSPISWKYAYHEIRSSLTRHLSDISIRMWAMFLLSSYYPSSYTWHSFFRLFFLETLMRSFNISSTNSTGIFPSYLSANRIRWRQTVLEHANGLLKTSKLEVLDVSEIGMRIPAILCFTNSTQDFTLAMFGYSKVLREVGGYPTWNNSMRNLHKHPELMLKSPVTKVGRRWRSQEFLDDPLFSCIVFSTT